MRVFPVYQPLTTDDQLEKKLGFPYDPKIMCPAPPAFALSLTPLSLLPYKACWWLIAFTSMLAILLGILFTARKCGLSIYEASFWTSLCFGSYPFLLYIAGGRCESLTYLLGLVGWWSLRSGRDQRAGLCWGLCAAFKLFPLFWLVALLASGRARAALIGLFTAIGITTLAGFLMGFDQMSLYALSIFNQSSKLSASGSILNHSIMRPDGPYGYSALGFCLPTATLAFALFTAWRKPDADSLFTTCCAASLVCFPLCWNYYFVFSFPCIVIARAHLSLDSAFSRALVGSLLLLFFWPGLLGGNNPWLTPNQLWQGLYIYIPSAVLVVLSTLPATKFWSNLRLQKTSRWAAQESVN